MDGAPVCWIFYFLFYLLLRTDAEVTITETSLANETLTHTPPKSELSDESVLPEDVGCEFLDQIILLNKQLTNGNSHLLDQLTHKINKNAKGAKAAMQTVHSSTAVLIENNNLVKDLTLATLSNARAIADVIKATRQNTKAIGVISGFLTDMKDHKYYFDNEENNISRRSIKGTEEGEGNTYFTVSLTETMKEARDNLLQKILPKQTITNPSPTPTVITDKDLMAIETPDISFKTLSTKATPTFETPVLDVRHRPVNPNVNIKARSCVTGFLSSQSIERFCALRTGHTWSSASAWCESQGLVLAQPKDIVAMSKRIHDSQSGRGWLYWLGGRGVGKIMKWMNGSDINSIDPVWRTGHPGYSTSSSDCLALQTSSFANSGLLRSYSCESDNLYVVCSMP